MRKKVSIFIVVMFVMLFAFAACAQNNNASPPADTGTASSGSDTAATDNGGGSDAKTFTIGYLGWDVGTDWNTYTLGGLQWGAENHGCTVLVTDAKKDANAQVSFAQEFITQGVDCMAMFPVTPESGGTIVRMANEAGIPIAVDNTFLATDGSAGEMVGQVACQYNDIGYAAIKWAAENVPNAKLLYVHGGPGEGVYELYQVGVDEALADFADKIEMVGLVNGNWIAEDSYTVTIDWITAGGAEFNVVFANNDAQAKGVDQALKEAGLTGIPIISTGGSNEGFEMLKDGIQAANMTAPANIQGIIQFGMLWAHMNGMTWGDPKIPLPVIPIDQNNIDEWIFWDDMDAGYAYVKNAIGPYTP